MNTYNLTNPGFIEAYYYESGPCNIDIHLHDMYEIYIAVSNNIKYYIEGHSYDLCAGDIIITNEKEVHRPTTIDKEPYRRKFIKFIPYGFYHYFDSDYNPLSMFENRVLGTKNLIPANNINNAKIQDIIDQIIILTNKKSPSNQLMIKSMMLQLFIYLYEAHTTTHHVSIPSNEYEPRVEKSLTYLNEHYLEPITLDEMSQALFTDKYYLTQLFKKSTGFTIMEYVQSKRIQYAKALISNGIPIMEVSCLCGFEDYSNFYKTFKKLTTISPKKYRTTSKLTQ